MKEEFVKLWFSGGRVPTGKLPVSLLPELKAYEKAIRGLATTLWKVKHGTKKLPNNFNTGFTLALCGEVHDGSAGISLACVEPSQIDLFGDVYKDAQDVLCKLLRRIRLGKELSIEDTPALEAAAKLGKRLQGDESLGIDPSASGKVRARMTRETTLTVQAELARLRRHVPCDVVGRIVTLDTINGHFGLASVDGPRFAGHYDRAAFRLTDELSLAIHRTAGYVRALGTSFVPVGGDAAERQIVATSITLVGQPTPDFEARIAELRRLDDANPALIEAAIGRVRDLVWIHKCPPPFVYLGDGGGLSLEWSLDGGWELSVDFEAEAIFGDATNILTTDADEFELRADASSEDLGSAMLGLFHLAGWQYAG